MLSSRYPNDKSRWIGGPALYIYRRNNYPELAKQHVDRKEETRLETRYGKTFTSSELPSASKKDIATRLMDLTGRNAPPPRSSQQLSDNQLLSFITGVEGFIKFAEELTMERGKPVVLQDYQKEMAQLFYNHDRVCICAGGQVGKDFMMQEYITWWAMTNPGSLQLVVCAVQGQAIALMNRILGLLKSVVDLYGTLSGTRMKPEAEIYFKNGSRVLFLTAKSLIAGHTAVSHIWVNEARDILEEEITRVSPLLGISSGKLIALSRPRFRRGYFWDCYSNPVFKSMKIATDQNIHFDKKVIEADRATLSPDLFKIEYLGEFADAGSSYFSENAIDECSRVDYDFRGMVAEPEYDYALGVDWARLRDTCVLAVVGRHKQSKNYKLFHLHSFSPEGGATTTFETHFAYIGLLASHFNFKYIAPESSGMGIPLSERLKLEWRSIGKPDIVKPYENRSLDAKLQMYEECKNIIETKRIQLPRSAFRLINELKMTQFGTTAHGHLNIETPITDDFADALCLTLMAFKQRFEVGVATVKRPLPRLFSDLKQLGKTGRS